MISKTLGVKELVSEVIKSVSKPYSEDVIEEVFLSIEHNTDWQERYYELVDELDKKTVNRWIGKYAKQITGLKNPSPVVAKRSNLTRTYSKLYP